MGEPSRLYQRVMAQRDAARTDAKALAKWVEAALNERTDHEEGVRLLTAHKEHTNE